MGSDGTDVDVDVDIQEATEELSAVYVSRLGLSQATQKDDTPEELAQVQIEKCLEHGVETIDLS